MIPFEVHILGSSSATPTATRHPTSQLVNFRERMILIDCGEGTQHQLRKFKLRFSKIDTILISHLHGDHYFGLVGLLSSFHLMNREAPIDIYGPEGLEQIIRMQFEISQTRVCYEIRFHPLESGDGLVYETEHLTVERIKLKHSIQCWGFILREKPRGRAINREGLDAHEVPNHAINKIRKGADYIKDDGTVVKNSLLSFDAPPSRSYAYLTDTMVVNKQLEKVKGVDLMYHEATFLEADKARAKKTQHSTTVQAAAFAKEAEVKQLMIGHFSARYKDLTVFLDETKAIFPNAILAEEGAHIIIS